VYLKAAEYGTSLFPQSVHQGKTQGQSKMKEKTKKINSL
jgi:hypothetical protein